MTLFTAFTFPATGGVTSRTDPARWGDWINALEFGATGNGSTDDTAAIQAAIDAAYGARKQGVRLPAGTYKISSPLFLDAPANLRSSLTVPTIFNFSMALVGDFAIGNNDSCGTRISPTAANFVALWVGPGQGMKVSNISIIFPVNAYRNTMSTSGCGIAIAGGSGGATRTMISECMVENCYQGIATGFNGVDALADQNTVLKSYISNCYIGFNVTQSQNYINSLIDCSFGTCTTSVKTTVAQQVMIRGGYYSCSDAYYKIFTIGTVSAFTTFTDTVSGSTFTNCRFTAVVASPDTAMNNATYDSAAVNLTGFGVVPLRLESFNTGTNTATFSLLPAWVLANFNYSSNVSTGTDLHTEIAAATTLYACENITVFSGRDIHASDIHVENANALTRLISSEGGVSTLDNFLFNYEISHGDYATSVTDTLALFMCQQCFPFIYQSQSKLTLSNNYFAQSSIEGIVVDTFGVNTLRFIGSQSLSPPIVRYCYSSANNIVGDSGNDPYSAVRGGGEFDVNPFFPPTGVSGFTNDGLVKWSNLQERISGRRPQPGLSRVTPTQATAYGALTAIGTYAPLCGDTTYTVSDYAASTAKFLLKSGAPFYSYGQNLTTVNIVGLSWSYKGQTTKVTMNAQALKFMFPGLKIILDNGSPQSIMVTGVHPALLYVDAVFIDTTNLPLPGVKTTTYTGTLVTQDAYAIVQI